MVVPQFKIQNLKFKTKRWRFGYQNRSFDTTAKWFLFFPVFLFAVVTKAQFYNLPGDYSFSLLTEKALAKKDSSLHSGVKPYIHFFSPAYVHVADSHRVFKYIKDDPALDVVFYKHLLYVEPAKQNFRLYLDPVLNFEYGRDLSAKNKSLIYTNTRGFIGSGYVGSKVYFETLFAENQSVFPGYIAASALSTLTVPGQGRWKAFRTTGFDYAFSAGLISIQASKNLNIQLGQGKQKIGYGYRSLLLSDNAFNYPYARITQQWLKGRVQYTNIYASLMNLVPAAAKQNPNTERLFQKKAASFQYLSLNAAKWLNLGFFQGMIWQAGDARNNQHLDAYYFNPVIFTNLIPFGLDNKNNIVAGGDVKVKLTNGLNVYGQWMLDNLRKSSFGQAGVGYQAGLQYFNAFSLHNLFLQAEYNQAGGGSYTSPPGLSSDQSYSHYRQGLAFTPPNGRELVLMGDYKWQRFFVTARYNYQSTLLNGDKHYQLHFLSGRVGYLINPSYNLNIYLGANYRLQNFYTFNALNNETSYIYLGLKTSLYNLYYDF